LHRVYNQRIWEFFIEIDFFCVSKLLIDLFFKLPVSRFLAINIEGKIGQLTVRRTSSFNKMSKYIQKVEKCSFLISRSVKCVTWTTKVDNSVLSELEIFSFIMRFLLENRVFFHLKRINHKKFLLIHILFYLIGI
jgi:hypothetical protein